ncbi:hypothetical protein PG996_011332 [Apiospora saccharicola]|uniref:Uncharacterized protein n=1 Tax=Apiospora saccharicola TaxID=335842 RepID=A0ABR1UH26_9PEZI
MDIFEDLRIKTKGNPILLNYLLRENQPDVDQLRLPDTMDDTGSGPRYIPVGDLPVLVRLTRYLLAMGLRVKQGNEQTPLIKAACHAYGDDVDVDEQVFGELFLWINPEVQDVSHAEQICELNPFEDLIQSSPIARTIFNNPCFNFFEPTYFASTEAGTITRTMADENLTMHSHLHWDGHQSLSDLIDSSLGPVNVEAGPARNESHQRFFAFPQFIRVSYIPAGPSCRYLFDQVVRISVRARDDRPLAAAQAPPWREPSSTPYIIPQDGIHIEHRSGDG